MMRMKPWRYAVGALIVAVVAFVAWRMLGGKKAEPDAPAPAALVTLAPVREASVEDTVTAYGTIAGSAAASRTVAAPRAVVVQRVLVTAGQAVGAGTPLIVLAGTPATQATFRQTTDAAAFAQRDLERVQRLFDAHLAANDQLIAARKTLADARAALAAQTATGGGAGAQTLTAPLAGVIGTVPVALGDHIAEGAPLMTVIATGGMVAQLAVEPGRATRLASGQSVLVASAFDDKRRFSSRLTVVGREVDPTSHMVGVAVPVTGGDLALGAPVRARITIQRHAGLLVPRQSVVFDEAGAHVFTVSGGKAHQVPVTPGAEQADDTEIAGAALTGKMVAVQGAYQLQDGLAVRTSTR